MDNSSQREQAEKPTVPACRRCFSGNGQVEDFNSIATPSVLQTNVEQAQESEETSPVQSGLPSSLDLTDLPSLVMVTEEAQNATTTNILSVLPGMPSGILSRTGQEPSRLMSKLQCIPHETLLGAYELRRDKKARCLQPETAIALAAALSFPLFF